jgi:hypothetical protein
MLEDVEKRYPAQHYVMVDDKLRILAEMKKVWGNRLTTIFQATAITRWTPTTLLTTRPQT